MIRILHSVYTKTEMQIHAKEENIKIDIEQGARQVDIILSAICSAVVEKLSSKIFLEMTRVSISRV